MDQKGNLKGGISFILIFLLILFQSVFLLIQCKNEPDEKPLRSNTENDQTDQDHLPDYLYAGTTECIECHQQEYHDWHGSHHDEAMMIASDSTVKADFSDITFFSQGVRSHFFRQDDKFMVETEGPDGRYQEYEILYTFGTEPLQQYIVKFPDGRYQCLRTAWDTEKNKWFDLYPDLKIAREEWLHWTNGSMTWNTACADCHSTNLHKNYFVEEDSFNTTYSIIDVSCEACHGPGKAHIDFVSSPFFDSTMVYNASRHLYMLKTDAPEKQVDECARCHSRRVQITGAYTHKGEFRDHYAPEILRDHLYYADGQILDEDYVYSSFVQTKMYMNHVRCTDCHNPHSTKLKLEGNKLCLQCHEPQKYDVFEHHFHKDDQGGQECINCHMDGRYYMVNDYRRDHSFRVPRPDLSVEYEVPNACNSCHTEKNADWSADWIREWYGADRNRNYADALTLGSTRTAQAVPALDTLVKSRYQPPIVRATAVWYLGFIDTEQSNLAIISALNDPDPTVRYIAIEVMQSFPPQLRYQYLAPLLKDPVRSVRVMAFDALSDIPAERFNEKDRSNYMSVLPEYREMLDMRADFPGGRLQMARYLERKGNLAAAEEALHKALSFDSLFNAARVNLAHLYHNQGKINDAIDLFKLVTRIEPQYGPAFYSLGLLYAENNNIDESINYLQMAVKKNPENPRIFYNLGLAYQKKKDFQAAENAFKEGLNEHPDNPDILYVLIIFYIQQERFKEANKYMPSFRKAYPNSQQANELEYLIRNGLEN